MLTPHATLRCLSKNTWGQKHFLKRLSLALLPATLLFGGWSLPAFADISDPFNPTGPRDFTLRYSADVPGNIEAIGNASLTCDTSDTVCSNALNSGTGGNNGAGIPMIMLDIDSDGSTFNSSSAQLNLPTGANVLSARLYWGGSTGGAGTTSALDVTKRNQVSLSTPSSGYQTITAGRFDDINPSFNDGFGGTFSWQSYAASTDITNLVQSGGNGTYTIGNVQANTGVGFTYPHAGWSIVVVYEDLTQPRRSMTLYDGYTFTGFDANTASTLTGIKTPSTSGFDVFFGAIVQDGEVDFGGDYLSVNGTPVSDILNPSNNIFNSTISKFGTNVATRTPSYPYNLVIDVDYLDISSLNLIPPGATSVDLDLNTTQDGLWPMAYFLAVEVFEPNLVTNFKKTSPETSYEPGDVIPYTITVENTGLDTAINTIVTDPLPTGLSFVSGSLKINGVDKSDTATDEAEFDGTNVIFRVGTGANTTQGGQVGVGETITMEFSATVNALPGEQICNQASISYQSATSGNSDSGVTDDPETAIVGDCTEISVSADYGDAPDTYGTDLSDTGEGVGPSHIILSGIHLGSIAPDDEADGQPSVAADLDGAEDDGVVLPGAIEPGETISLPVTVTGSGALNAWLDWDGNGIFDASEQIATDVVDGGAGDTDGVSGTITLSVTAPVGATIGDTYARFRYSSQTGLSPLGAATDGEVEDYQVVIEEAASMCSLTSQLDNPLNLDFSNGGVSPTLLSGTADTVGAVYLFDDVAAGVDARVTLEALSFSTSADLRLLTDSDGSGILGGQIRSIPDGLFQFKVDLVDADTTTPIAPVDLVIIAFDIDGNPGNTVTDFAEFINANGYFLNDPTFLTTTDGAKFTNTNTGVNDGSDSPSYAAGAIYLDTNTFTIRGGLENAGTNNAKRLVTFNVDDSVLSSFFPLNCVPLTPAIDKDYGDAPDTYGTDAIDNSGEGVGASHTIVSGIHLGTAPDAEADAVAPLDGTGDGADEDGVTFATLIANSTTYSIPASNITVTNNSGLGTATLHAWVDFDGSGTFDSDEYTIQTVSDGTSNGNPNGALTWSGEGVSGMTVNTNTYARFRLTTDSSLGATTPGEVAHDGEVEDYQVAITSSNPNMLLVKRITAINGFTTNPNDSTDLTLEIDSSTNPDDDAFPTNNWPSNYLVGATNGGVIKPGDEIEYTVYFLNDGDIEVNDVRICDRIQAGQSFQLGSDPSRSAATQTRLGTADAQLQMGTSAIIDLTAANDGSDRTQLVDVGTTPSNCNLSVTNDNGTLVLDLTGAASTGDPALTELPTSTGQGAPNDSYGFFRFVTKVNE